MDLYSTNALTRAVQSLKQPQSFLLDRFFGSVITEDSEEIHFDVLKGKRRIAPFVSPLISGKIVENMGFETKTYKPAYIKMRTPLDSERPFKRAAGEPLTGASTPAARQATLVSQTLQEHREMVTRRLEVMAAETLRTGKLTISGEGFNTQSIDFGRDMANTKTLTAGDRWGEAGVDPIKNIEEWGLAMRKLCGAGIVDVVMDVEAWDVFRSSIDTETLFNSLRANTGASANTVVGDGLGYQMMGTDGVRNYYVYSDWYINDAGTEVPILPANTVILGSSLMEGVRHFGAIRDENHGFMTGDLVSRSWVENDPSIRMILSQSAPLTVPYRPDAAMCVQVR